MCRTGVKEKEVDEKHVQINSAISQLRGSISMMSDLLGRIQNGVVPPFAPIEATLPETLSGVLCNTAESILSEAKELDDIRQRLTEELF